MLRELLKKSIKSQASYVEVGYGQVEPNHLSAQRTAQIYAQLPAASDIKVLEQGQFVKYDYANGLVNFDGKGEWMLVYNETKLYREEQLDCEFAMIKEHYGARVYSPLDGEKAQEMYGPTRFLKGVREAYDPATGEFHSLNALPVYGKDGKIVTTDGLEAAEDKSNWSYADFSVAAKYHDYYEMSDINNPEIAEEHRKRMFMKLREYEEKMMPTGTTMVPRVFKTNVGDIMTTNTINATELKVGDILTPGAKKTNADGSVTGGILEVTNKEDGMLWQVVKVYTMPDHQRGAKIMRIQ